MINSIRLQSFQSHKDTHLEFHEGVNVIVGDSATGKTAILRGMKWVMFNKPKGDSYRSHWGGDIKIDIELDKDTITRTKGETTNTYSLDDKIFKAFGQGVPDEIVATFNMGSVNVQYQFDRHFLLADTPGEVAQYLNRIVGLDAIDRGMSNIASKSRKAEQDLSYAKKSLNEDEESLKEFDYIDKAEVGIEQLEKLQEAQQNLYDKEAQLSHLVGEIEIVENVLIDMPDLGSASASIENLLLLEKKLNGLVVSKDDLLELLSNITVEQNIIEAIPDLLSASTDISRLLDIEDKLVEVDIRHEKLYTLFTMITKEENNLKIISGKLLGLTNEYEELVPDECPLCGGTMG